MSTPSVNVLTAEDKAARLRRAITLRSQGKLSAEQDAALNRIIGNPNNKDIVKLAIAEPAKEGEGISMFGGLIGPESFTQAMFGMSPEQLRELRDAPPMAGETPTTAGLRTLFAGTGGSASETASSFTSPASIALGGAGAVAQAGGRGALAARTLLGAAGAAGGVVGTGDVIEGLTSEELNAPERAEKLLSGSSGVLGAAPVVGQVSRSLSRTQPAAIQEKALSAAIGVDTPLAKEALPALRTSARDLGLKRSDFKGEGAMDKFGEVLTNAKAILEKPVVSALRQHGNKQFDGNVIADAIEAKITTTMQKLRPEEVQAIRDEAARYRKQLTLNELNEERMALNADLNSFYKKGQIAQTTDVKKTNALRLVAKTARDNIAAQLYNELDSVVGTRPGTFRDIKNQESKLLKVEERFVKQSENIRKADARHEALGFMGRLREAVPTGIAFESARVPVGRALLAERPSATEGRFLQKAFSRLPEQPVPASQLTRAAIIGLLNALSDEEE